MTSMTQPLPPLMMRHRSGGLVGYGRTPGFDLPGPGELVNVEQAGGGYRPYTVTSVEWFTKGGKPFGGDGSLVYTPGNVIVFLSDSTHQPGPLPTTGRVDLWHNGSQLGRMVKTLEPKLHQVINLEDDAHGRRRWRCTDVEWWWGNAGPGGSETIAMVYQAVGKRCHLTLIAND